LHQINEQSQPQTMRVGIKAVRRPAPDRIADFFLTRFAFFKQIMKPLKPPFETLDIFRRQPSEILINPEPQEFDPPLGSENLGFSLVKGNIQFIS